MTGGGGGLRNPNLMTIDDSNSKAITRICKISIPHKFTNLIYTSDSGPVVKDLGAYTRYSKLPLPPEYWNFFS